MEELKQEEIIYCQFYDVCNAAVTEHTCRTGGGKYCGIWRRLKETQPKQRTITIINRTKGSK